MYVPVCAAYNHQINTMNYCALRFILDTCSPISFPRTPTLTFTYTYTHAHVRTRTPTCTHIHTRTRTCICPWESHSGKYPQEIHVHVQRYELSELPEDDASLGHWIKARYSEKEQRLANFYERDEHTFADAADACSGPLSFREMLGPFLGVVHMVFMVVNALSLVYVWWWKYYLLAAMGFLWAITEYGGGCDGLQEVALDDALHFE